MIVSDPFGPGPAVLPATSESRRSRDRAPPPDRHPHPGQQRRAEGRDRRPRRARGSTSRRSRSSSRASAAWCATLEFDVCEMALTTYLTAKAHGVRFTAIPAFLVRGFHHNAITVDTRHGITSPKDLEGRKVGVNRGYTVTTGVWARSILADEHGVDLDSITWVLSGDEHVAQYRPPANVVPAPAGRTPRRDARRRRARRRRRRGHRLPPRPAAARRPRRGRPRRAAAAGPVADQPPGRRSATSCSPSTPTSDGGSSTRSPSPSGAT